MGKYAKGWAAGIGSILTTGMTISDQFCGSWYPALVALLTTVGVVAVPNSGKKED